jgi:hypothetical protein
VAQTLCALDVEDEDHRSSGDNEHDRYYYNFELPESLISPTKH